MKVKFTKMHGCGNDYIYIEGTQVQAEPQKKAELVRRLSDRHFGIGGDGVIFIHSVSEDMAKELGQQVDFEMEMYNADGSRAEMCGNGIRCVAKYVYDKGLTDKKEVSIVSCGKVKHLELSVEKDKVVNVKVNMGAPVMKAGDIPVISEHEEVMDEEIDVDGKKYKMTCVSMGNPHAVIFVEDENILTGLGNVDRNDGGKNDSEKDDSEKNNSGKDDSKKNDSEKNNSGKNDSGKNNSGKDMKENGGDVTEEGFDGTDRFGREVVAGIGPLIEKHSRFPRRTNTEFVKVLDRKTVQMRVWERGTGETLACGTGACATVVACILNGLTEEEVTVKLLGGELNILWDRKENLVYMTGPVETVFDGEIDINI